MKVIDAMLNKIKSPALLMGFTKILDAVADSFVTSLSTNQISALVRMQLSDLRSGILNATPLLALPAAAPSATLQGAEALCHEAG